MEITAKEIERQATRLDEEAAIFDASCNTIIKRLHSMEEIVKSDDSNLARRIGEYANAYIQLHGNLAKKFQNLAGIMHKYAADTLANEGELQQLVGISAGAMEGIAEAIANSGIDFN